MRREHPCLGQCGRIIPRRRVACLICWRRLPERYRAGIMGDRTRFPSWSAAVQAAGQWYTHHPVKKRHRTAQAALRSPLPAQPAHPGVMPC